MMPTHFLFLLLLIANCCKAQQSSITLHFDTLEGVFKKSNQSKDGYLMLGTVFDIPSSIAAKCDNKQIRLLGFASSHYVTADNLMFFNNNGNVEFKEHKNTGVQANNYDEFVDEITKLLESPNVVAYLNTLFSRSV